MKAYALTDEERAEVKEALKKFVLTCCSEATGIVAPGAIEILPAMTRILLEF